MLSTRVLHKFMPLAKGISNFININRLSTIPFSTRGNELTSVLQIRVSLLYTYHGLISIHSCLNI